MNTKERISIDGTLEVATLLMFAVFFYLGYGVFNISLITPIREFNSIHATVIFLPFASYPVCFAIRSIINKIK